MNKKKTSITTICRNILKAPILKIKQKNEHNSKISLDIIKVFKPQHHFCSDFRYEINGIFVLGVGFYFRQTNFDFLTSHF